MADTADKPSRRPVAFFKFTADELSDENIDATAERVAKAMRERSSRSPDSDDSDQDSER